VLPGGLDIVGAYVSGDTSSVETLAMEVTHGLKGSFLVAAVADGATSFFQRFSTTDALVGVDPDPTPLDEDWLDREYALFRCEMRVPIGAENSQGVARAFAAAEAEVEDMVFVVDVAGEAENDEASAEKNTDVSSARGKKGKPGKGKPGKRGNDEDGSKKSKAGNRIETRLFARPSARRIIAGNPRASTEEELVSAYVVPRRETRNETAAFAYEARPAIIAAADGDGPRAPTIESRAETARTAVAEDEPVSTSLASFAHLDCLAYASRGVSFGVVAARLREACERQLFHSRRALQDQCELRQTCAWKRREPRCLHFRLSSFSTQHCVTAAYLLPPESGARGARRAADPDLGLETVRERYHDRFGVSSDVPLLRTASAVCFSRGSRGCAIDPLASRRLRNVHAAPLGGLPKSHVANGTPHCVRGDYEYYHYSQDRFDDTGWGCAYRSCQTLCSWFAFQRYTSGAVPSHREIQETLVKIGDKPASFLGSSEWIGALEVSYVLDELYGFSCKIMTVDNGLELPSRARELANHFDDVGTPVMMGGGKLAYTLLGVDWDENTGECAFLILDPHYAGGEDLKRIVPRWCGWKKCEDVFVREFYNLVMPIPPKGV
jgi:hypothetical protein